MNNEGFSQQRVYSRTPTHPDTNHMVSPRINRCLVRNTRITTPLCRVVLNLITPILNRVTSVP